ncbi:hypothetical protein ANN_02227 [Periplaneta americana]|uniref:Uncharacterized protein n=1 Tax=Periplaneta americana TaxID=6978 RepID=A0ABQ8TYP0_PERAM|nr:hypothetical protein ANN_02227 [Periplaneta americana]
MPTQVGLAGEYVVKPGGIVDELSPGSSALAEEEPSSLIDLPGFSLEEALQLVGLDEDSTEVKSIKQDPAPQSGSSTATSSVAKDIGVEELKPEPDDLLDNSDEELGILSDMIQTAQFHHPHPRSFQDFVSFLERKKNLEHTIDSEALCECALCSNECT